MTLQGMQLRICVCSDFEAQSTNSYLNARRSIVMVIERSVEKITQDY